MKRKIFWLCALRESAKCCIILAGLFIICLPEAWAEGGTPLALVVLAMVGCGALIRWLWAVVCGLERCIFRLRKLQARQEQWEREAPMREERRRQEWQRYFAEQEQGA